MKRIRMRAVISYLGLASLLLISTALLIFVTPTIIGEAPRQYPC